MQCRAPVGVGQHAGEHVGDEDGADRHEHVLDPVEASAHDEQRDAGGGEGHAQVAAHPEELEARGDPGELRARGAHVGEHEGGHRHGGSAHAIGLAHQPGETLAGDHAHAGPEVVEEHERDRGQQQHPQEAVAVVGTQHRVGGDPRRVVVGQPGQQTRAHHGGEDGESAT